MMWLEHYDASLDWLGFSAVCPSPQRTIFLAEHGDATAWGDFVTASGEARAKEPVTGTMRWGADALEIVVRCEASKERLSRMHVQEDGEPSRDAWGQDAVEIQIDPSRDGSDYAHFIIPLRGKAIAFKANNNRTMQGWSPDFLSRVTIQEGAWQVELTLPFELFGKKPSRGDVWGLNIFRANPVERSGLSQWAPTYGNALSPELFGTIRFAGKSVPASVDAEAFARRAACLETFFQKTINGVSEEDTLAQLSAPSWKAWAEHLAKRENPRALCFGPFSQIHGRMLPEVEGLLPGEHAAILADADARTEAYLHPDKASLPTCGVISKTAQAMGGLSDIFEIESIGTAWLLTKKPVYAEAFGVAIRRCEAYFDMVLPESDFIGAMEFSGKGCYHDSQSLKMMTLAYVYVAMREAPLSPETHAATMRMILRSCRFSSFHIRHAYVYGNHQVYESAGLAFVASLFPEFAEQRDWALCASRAICRHLEREVYPDGGYRERCGYHCDALRYINHAVRNIEVGGCREGFEELFTPETRARLESMAEWMLLMNAPDGSTPAFGDGNASSALPELRRCGQMYHRPDMLWPVRMEPEWSHLAAEAIPPAVTSVSLASGFTVMRDGWKPDSFYMAVDHGPLGGQHSHCDSMGFVAYAHGIPLAIDCGIGASYDDGMYVTVFRRPASHNIILVDDVEPEKVSEAVFLHSGPGWDVLRMRGFEYRRQLGWLHERTVYFLHGVGWMVYDDISREDGKPLGNHDVAAILNVPLDMTAGPDMARGTREGVSFSVMMRHGGKPLTGMTEPAKAAIPRRPADPLVFNRTGTLTRLRYACRTDETMSKLGMSMLLIPSKESFKAIDWQETAEGWSLSVAETAWHLLRDGNIQGLSMG